MVLRQAWVFIALVCLVIAPYTQAQTLSQRIAAKETQVRQFAANLEAIYSSRCGITEECGCQYSACLSEFPTTECSTEATLPTTCSCQGMMMDTRESAVRIATLDQVYQPTDRELQETMCFSKSLDPNFIQNEQADPDTEWQAFGSYTGMMRIFPARSQSTCDSYDPRLRSWYIAASSGPKDIVIVLDTSGSMSDSNRMEIAKEAVISVINSLTISDFFAVVSFSSYANRLGSSPVLVRATADNKELLVAEVERLYASGGTNFGEAFSLAFDLLDASQSSATSSAGCRAGILFLTDGRITVGDEAGQVTAAIAARLSSATIPPAIFTYSLGSGADQQTTKQIACESNGMWQHLEDNSDIRTDMSLYYDYFSLGISANSSRVTWVEPFAFATDNTVGTSASMPVYDRSTNPPRLLGVVGTGFSLAQLEAVAPNPNAILEDLIARSAECPDFSLNECQLQSLRARSSTESMCPGECDTLVELNPLPCNDNVYPSGSEMWCNTNNQFKEYGEAVCCADDTGAPCALNPSSPASTLGPSLLSILFLALLSLLSLLLQL